MLPALMLAAAIVMQAEPATDNQQTRPIGSRVQTDQTVNVTKGMRVVLDECAGDVIVTTWERDAVRVRAEHSRSAKVEISPRDQVLHITRDGRSSVDYELTLPAWAALSVEGTHCFVDVKGLGGALQATTVEGDITLRDLAGTATVESIEGTIRIEGGRGRVQAKTSDGDIESIKSGGELLLESIDGSITVTDATATALEVTTVDGDVVFSGAFQANGRYRFETHDGSLLLVLPENTGATFQVRRYDGPRNLDSTLPLKASGEPRGRRMTYTLGNGSAQVEIESFDGDVKIRKPGEVKKEK